MLLGNNLDPCLPKLFKKRIMSDRNFYQQLRSVLERQPVVMATIVQVIGSAPREVGAKMAIYGDRNTIGTIGGGAGEGKVIERALAVLKTGEKQLVELDLTGASGKEIQGVCGGKVQVWLEKWSLKSAIALISEILQVYQTGQTAELITPLTPKDRPYLTGDRGCGKLANHPYESTPFTETIQPPPMLLLIGGGHVAVALAQIASFAGFEIAVQDDRPEFVTSTRFPQATYLFKSLDLAWDSLNSSPLYITLLTRGLDRDLDALKTIIRHSPNYQYLGAIGSRKRIRAIAQTIPITQMPHFYAPIGLDIGALTPEEIAISICGELIKVRRGGTGLSLSDRLQLPQTSKRVHLANDNHLSKKVSRRN